MHLHYLLLSCLPTLIQCGPLPTRSGDLLRSLNLTVDQHGATVFSLLYGSPLLSFVQFASKTIGGEGTNVLGFNGNLSDASTHDVVRPNVDTIYATATYDLAATDLVLTVPPMESDRYYSFSFFDPYGDNYVSLGNVDANSPGKYLVTEKACCEGYSGCVKSPTTVGTLLVRVEAKFSPADTADVDAFLSKCSLEAINPRKASTPALTLADFAGLSNSTAISALQLTARLQSRASPETELFRAAVPAILELAGIRHGSYRQPAGVNLTQASALAEQAITAWTNSPSSYSDFGNGWISMNGSIAGTFENGTDIVPRALIAATLYLQNTANNALYPVLGSTQLDLTDGESYLFTFSGKPPVQEAGFWSLTMYDVNFYLVPNAENTWAVGDRSNITYSDGDLIYGNGTGSGSFQVLVQDAGVKPPGNWTANWLPAPPGGGPFTVTFRIYAPVASLSDGTYVYPVVTKGKAITA
ncbi:hypothetical protein LTR15_012953 [Elasticomyces elasticus]|nr:hypothetical protein LTR15_012953 [Elasticomyces elasticus]